MRRAELVLGHHAEADRQHPFGPRVEQHHGRDRGPGKPEFFGRARCRARPRASLRAPRRTSTPPARRGRGGSRTRAAAARTPGTPHSRHVPDRSGRSARRAGRAPQFVPRAARRTRAAWRARRPGASGCSRAPASPTRYGGRRRRRPPPFEASPAGGADRRRRSPAVGFEHGRARALLPAHLRISRTRSVAAFGRRRRDEDASGVTPDIFTGARSSRSQ